MSPEDVCNLSLDEIRAGVTVQSINPSDGSLAGNVMSRHYQLQVDNVSRAAQWNCLRYQAPLALLRAAPGTYANPSGLNSGAPPVPWLYEYALPAQPACLRMRYVFPHFPAPGVAPGAIISLPPTPLTTGNIATFPNGSPSRPIAAPFAVSKDLDAKGNTIRVVLTNAPYAIGVYTSRENDPTNWDPQFVTAVVMTLAAWTAEPITGSSSMVVQKSQIAASLVNAARVSDGDEGTQTTDHIPDWIQIRYGGAAFGLANQPGLWDTLALPFGAV